MSPQDGFLNEAIIQQHEFDGRYIKRLASMTLSVYPLTSLEAIATAFGIWSFNFLFAKNRMLLDSCAHPFD